uniref:Uncharacterized protein n=1 Tax=Cucumis melo TaxID=3656 RepID=A0A9I9E8T3_CUCME
TKSSEDGSEPTPEATPHVAICTSTRVFEKDIGDKYEKLQMKVINLKEENVMLMSTILDIQDQLT